MAADSQSPARPSADPLVETWQIHDRINQYLLAAIPASGLDAIPLTGGRTVAKTFAHMHNVRLMWLQAAGVPVPAAAAKLEPDSKLSGSLLKKSLTASTQAITTLIESSLLAGGKVKGFKPHIHAFVGYLIAHESHHRGQMAVALKASGAPLDKKTAYGLWEWGVR